jgi:HAD superfamily hydrolase (TIGR01509 family)
LHANLFNIYQHGVPFKPGFEAFFKHVKTLNIPIGLVTSAERKGTEFSFERSGYLKDFDVVITLDEVTHPKPASEPYLLACASLGVRPKHTLVFEDSNIGLTAAINAGCQTVAIADLIAIDEVIKKQCFAVLDDLTQAYHLL